MPIKLQCPSCARELKAADNLAGKKVKCPFCSSVLPVPEPIHEAEELPGASPEIERNETVVSEGEELRRPCPMCGEMIIVGALKCRHCGEFFDETLRRKKKDKSNDSTADYVVAIICPFIGFIAGIVWMIQGKKKGWKVFMLSFVGTVFWSVIQLAAGRHR